MSTGMRKWMEKGCPDIPTTPAEVSIGREELRQLRDELAQYKNERDALRAKVERMEKQGPGFRERCTPSSPTGYSNRFPLYALPGAQPAQSAPSEEAAAEMGANGGHVVEAERLAFEAWMRGHCWKLGAKWTGTEYRSAFEKGGMVDMHAMRTRELWAAWRDRAALAAAPEAKP